MFSNPFESTLQKLVQMMGACKLILLMTILECKRVESHPYLLHRQCRLISATLFQLFGRLHIKTGLSISGLSLEPSSEQQLTLVQDGSARQRTIAQQTRAWLPSSFFASASTILISSTQSSGFLSQESPVTDMFHTVCFTQRLVGACCGLLVVLMAIHELLCVIARPHPSWSLRAALVQFRSHVHPPSILWIRVVCSDCSALLHTAQIPAETVVA